MRNVHYNMPVPVINDPALGMNNPIQTMFNPLMPSRKRPARTPGLAGTNTAFLVPDNVRKKFMDGGWSSHVPLTYLTDKGCLFKDRSSTVLAQDLLTVDPTSGAIQTTSTTLSEEGELDLTFDEWHQAWRRLLDLIRTFIPNEFHMWQAHYSTILNKENRAEMWPLYLAYDAEIRRRATQLPIDPSMFSIGVWNDLEVRYTANKVLSMVQSDLKHLSAHPPHNHAHSDKQNTRTPGQNSSFRGHNPPADSTKTGRCIFCGDRTKDHLSRNCLATCNTNGVPCHLYRVEPSGIRQSKSDKRYCYAWNGPSSCDKGSACRRGEHLCSLCGSSTHAAQLCDATA